MKRFIIHVVLIFLIVPSSLLYGQRKKRTDKYKWYVEYIKPYISENMDYQNLEHSPFLITFLKDGVNYLGAGKFFIRNSPYVSPRHATFINLIRGISSESNTSDLEKDEFYIQISARRSLPDDKKSLTGHAFVVFSKNDSQAKNCVIDQAYGFYPNPENYPLAVWKKGSMTVDGNVVDEFGNEPEEKKSALHYTNKAIIRVDAKTYQKGINYAKEYSKSYNLATNNCISFVNDLMTDVLGLKMTVLDRVAKGISTGKLTGYVPEIYVNGVIDQFDFIANNGGLIETTDGGIFTFNNSYSYLGNGKVMKSGNDIAAIPNGKGILMIKNYKQINKNNWPESYLHFRAGNFENGFFKEGLINVPYRSDDYVIEKGKFSQNLVQENPKRYSTPILRDGERIFRDRKVTLKSKFDKNGFAQGAMTQYEHREESVYKFNFENNKPVGSWSKTFKNGDIINGHFTASGDMFANTFTVKETGVVKGWGKRGGFTGWNVVIHDPNKKDSSSKSTESGNPSSVEYRSGRHEGATDRNTEVDITFGPTEVNTKD